MPVKKNISKDELYKLYIEENMPLIDVAKHFGASEARKNRKIEKKFLLKNTDTLFKNSLLLKNEKKLL